MKTNQSNDFEQGDVIVIEDKVEDVIETCKVISENDGIWTLKTEMNNTIKYSPKKETNYKIYRYKFMGIKND